MMENKENLIVILIIVYFVINVGTILRIKEKNVANYIMIFIFMPFLAFLSFFIWVKCCITDRDSKNIIYRIKYIFIYFQILPIVCELIVKVILLVNLEEKKKSRKVLRLSVKNILNDFYKERVIYNH